MSHLLPLPPLKENEYLDFPYFPNSLCLFVYRNWGMISPSVIAKTIEADTCDIIKLASDMGLAENPDISDEWLIKGYITLIRQNWHLITYDQLCLLLGWDIEKLAYILKEDDFLDIKLGGIKPDVPKLIWKPLTDEEYEKLESVREATINFEKNLPLIKIPPFAFKPFFNDAATYSPRGISFENSIFTDRIVYSYCALYGDTFAENAMESFPDELLRAYEAVGVNGIWCQAVLYTLVEFPFDPSVSACYEKRIKGLRELVERLAKYGIKLYLYLNEPRTMPNGFFEKYPELRGCGGGSNSCLCTSAPQVQKYLYDSAVYLVKNAPGLGGFITITASENQTNCYSHRGDGGCECPRCKNRSKAEVIAELNTILYSGGSSVDPAFRHIAWTWGWEFENIAKITDLMPDGITVMGVSEQAVEKNIGGVVTSVIDYSISVVGPGEYAKKTWEHAKAKNHAAFAKCQFNNTWECSFIPFLPAFEQIYKHICGLVETKVDGLMLDWTLGGYPSPTFAMLAALYAGNYSREVLPSLRELYERVFPAESIDVVESACGLFSEAFDEFPFHINVVYTAAQNVGCTNQLWLENTGWHATMVGYPYDDLNCWKSIFPVEVYIEQLKKLSEKWFCGIKILRSLDEKTVANTPSLSLLSDCAEAAYCHFRSSYLQSLFIYTRDDIEKNRVLLCETANEEGLLAKKLASLLSKNPLIGYESSNHYFYTQNSLAEKYINTEYIKRQLLK